MPKVTLYTKSNCKQCDVTKTLLDKNGIAYELVNLEANPEIVEQFMEQGMLSAPVVIAGDDTWSGFKPAKIKALVSMKS